MTQRGFAQLQQELDMLKTVKRPQIIQAIADARAHGDLKENAEYHAAREQQGFVEARIRDLEAKLSQAHVIDITLIAHTGKVIFGATIKLLNINNDMEVSYQIVCEDEADFKIGKISVSSPIARALIGKEEGQVISIETPGGVQEYEILEVLHL
jgi:transcription elongation factor GreA